MTLHYYFHSIPVAVAKSVFILPRILVVGVVALGMGSTVLASNHNVLVAQTYRWLTVDGPFGYPFKEDLQHNTRNRTDDTELAMVGQLRVYYLIPGNVVQVVQEDTTNGMSKIRTRGIGKDLWTFTKFLSKRPIKDTYGVFETPETISINAGDQTNNYGSR